MTKEQMNIGSLLYPEHFPRPRVRYDCVNAPRPCPYVGCRYHLYLDVGSNGTIKLNFPDLQPWDLSWSCALDVADVGEAVKDGTTLEATGRLINLTRERVRQVEENVVEGLRQYYPDEEDE